MRPETRHFYFLVNGDLTGAPTELLKAHDVTDVPINSELIDAINRAKSLLREHRRLGNSVIVVTVVRVDEFSPRAGYPDGAIRYNVASVERRALGKDEPAECAPVKFRRFPDWWKGGSA